VLENFYKGFFSSPLQILGLAALVVFFFAGLVLYTVVRNRREKKRRLRRTAEIFQERVKRHDLTLSEIEALHILARYLRSSDQKYLLLTNQGLFDSCVEKALPDRAISQDQISTIRVKLGFAGKAPASHPISSAELPPGDSVLLLQEGFPALRGRIEEQQPSAFLVHMEQGSRVLPSGSKVEVLYQNASGMYTFVTRVHGTQGQIIQLSHSEEVKRYQRRRYYRRNITLPVLVRTAGSEEKPLKSQFHDIGGGGASLENPQKRFKPGADVELMFHPQARSTLNVVGSVVRTSKAGNVMHVTFEKMKEATRDRIYRVILSGK